MNKREYLGALYQAWSGCQACLLCEERQNIVFGFGNPDSQVMIIGEAPGANEDATGVPFVGQAGHLLDQYLAMVSCRSEVTEAANAINSIRGSSINAENERQKLRVQLRELLFQEFYFTNVVMCRPPDNRDPATTEIQTCKTRLYEQIYTIDPVIILAAGRIAAEALVGKKVAITTSRGEIFDVDFQGRGSVFRYPVMPVLHPAYLLRRNDFRQTGGEGEKTYRDFLRAMHIVDEYNLRHYGLEKPKSRPKLEK